MLTPRRNTIVLGHAHSHNPLQQRAQQRLEIKARVQEKVKTSLTALQEADRELRTASSTPQNVVESTASRIKSKLQAEISKWSHCPLAEKAASGSPFIVIRNGYEPSIQETQPVAKHSHILSNFTTIPSAERGERQPTTHRASYGGSASAVPIGSPILFYKQHYDKLKTARPDLKEGGKAREGTRKLMPKSWLSLDKRETHNVASKEPVRVQSSPLHSSPPVAPSTASLPLSSLLLEGRQNKAKSNEKLQQSGRTSTGRHTITIKYSQGLKQ